MPSIHWLEVHPSAAGRKLRVALGKWGHELLPGPGPGAIVLVADHPDVRLIPAEGTEILWWVEKAEPGGRERPRR